MVVVVAVEEGDARALARAGKLPCLAGVGVGAGVDDVDAALSLRCHRTARGRERNWCCSWR